MTEDEHPGTPKQAQRRARADRGAPPDPIPVDPDQPTPEDLATFFHGGTDTSEVPEPEIMRALVGRVLDTENQGGLWQRIEPVHAAQITETPLSIMGYQLRRSQFPDGVGVYLLIDAVNLQTGEVLLIQCGAVNVVAQLLTAAELVALEMPLKFEQRPSQINPGRMLLWLRPVDQPLPQ